MEPISMINRELCTEINGVIPSKTRVIYDGETLNLHEYGMSNIRDIFNK